MNESQIKRLDRAWIKYDLLLKPIALSCPTIELDGEDTDGILSYDYFNAEKVSARLPLDSDLPRRRALGAELAKETLGVLLPEVLAGLARRDTDSEQAQDEEWLARMLVLDNGPYNLLTGIISSASTTLIHDPEPLRDIAEGFLVELGQHAMVGYAEIKKRETETDS